jgi:hypothetical protein
MYDDIDQSYISQNTFPASPYHDTHWSLPIDQVTTSLQHHKEKKLGYLELYFQGFMEFVDDELPTPERSDDEEEYPSWGSFSANGKKMSTSSAASTVSHEDEQDHDRMTSSITSDDKMCHSPARMASPDHDTSSSKPCQHNHTPTAIASHHPSLRIVRRHHRRVSRKQHVSIHCHAVGHSRLKKGHCDRSRSRTNKHTTTRT